jgi:3-deoxy-manno-octulosonate cytidylyltransferase (CMP-KDO synthetase)
MTTLAVLPARLGATRLPRKPLRLLGGLPLIVRVWQRVRDLGVADHVVVATDSEEIAGAVRMQGGEVRLTRGDHPSGTDRVAEVAERGEFSHCNVIVNVQGDEPFVSEDAIRGAVALVTSGTSDIGTAAVASDLEILARPEVVKVVCREDGRAMYFSRAPIPWLRDRQDEALLAGHVRAHVGLYAFSRQALTRWVLLPPHPLERIEQLEQLRPLAAGLSIGVHTLIERFPGGIDTEDDLERANRLWDEQFASRV